MLKQIMALLFVLSAAGCSPVLQMTREECREQKEIIGSVRIIRAEMRALAAAYRPIRRERMPGMPFGFNHPWTVAKTLKCVMWKFISFPRRYVRLWQMPRRERPKCWLTAACGEFARKMRVFAGFLPNFRHTAGKNIGLTFAKRRNNLSAKKH